MRAVAAGGDAFVHPLKPLTAFGTAIAGIGAKRADGVVVLGAEQHHVGRGPAKLGTGHHPAEMMGLGVLAAHFQAVMHRRR